jgi:hypothetical protein
VSPSAARPSHLHVAQPLDLARETGGELRDPYGLTPAWAKLPPGPYWVTVKGWRIAPQRFGWRKPRRGEKEREQDWRVFLHAVVTAVPDAHPQAAEARSSVFHYQLDTGAAPWIPVALRFSVTEKSELRIVPAGGHLWELLAITGQRGAALTADVMDSWLGWTLLVETRIPTHHRRRPGQHQGPAIPPALQHAWGYAVSDARSPGGVAR